MAKKIVKKVTKKTAKKVVKKATKKVVKKTAPRKIVKKQSAKKVSPSKASAGKKVSVKKASKKPVTKAVQRTNSVSPYLTFGGNCEEAFNFYRSTFGGNFQYMGKFKEMPTMDGKPMPASEGEKIMHVSLPIGGGTVLMGSDSSEAFGQITTVGNNFSISINASSQAEADRLFNGLSAGGKITMPMDATFWGSYFGMFTDKFDILWMVSFDKSPSK